MLRDILPKLLIVEIIISMRRKLLLSVILLGCFTIVHAHKFEIVEFVEKPMDQSAQIHQRKDANGRDGLDSIDLKHRRYILDFIEQLRTAYNQKDIKFIEQVFGNTLFIQGNVKTSKNEEKRTSNQYLNNLKKIFARNINITTHFKEIEINQHQDKSNIYGVVMFFEWSSEKYHDEGYLFQLWDFTDENVPQIHICTWQPAVINGKPLPKNEVFSLKDFDI